MTPRPGDPAFFANIWRRNPAHYRGWFAPDAVRSLDEARFRAWCDAPVRARIYVPTEDQGPGTALARVAYKAVDALAIYDHYTSQGALVTVLLNGVDAVDPVVVGLQDSFQIPYRWRRTDTVATLSVEHSGIGYHAGREDGFIVQVSGRRAWRIWHPSVLSTGYRASLCGHPHEPERLDARPSAPPLFACELEPGDALYVPALFPHEGVTLSRSVSLSLAWLGISAYEAWFALRLTAGHDAPLEAAERAGLFDLLADPPPAEDATMFLAGELERALSCLGTDLRSPGDEIRRFAVALVARGLAHSSSRATAPRT